MQVAPLPNDEARRLSVLSAHQIMDSARDPRFDSLVELAADMFDVPIALVSLVDANRQWFKALHGLNVCETSRDVAFCPHTMNDPSALMVVPDAAADPRFFDNPLVLGAPYIRFYAGATVRADSGEALGTLCLIDTAPRDFDATARQRLRRLADSVSAMIQLHRSTVMFQQAATKDSLTGLANRSLFDQRLAEAVAAAAEGRPCALLLADLDGFKSINDQFGHLAGDAVLQEVGRRLDVTVRAADLAARFGGDEFAIVMSDLTDPAVAEKVAKRISDRVRAPLQIGSDLIVPQLSIGVAHCPLDALDTRGLLHAADQALYKAKRHGRGRTVVAGQTVLAANGAAASPAVTLTDGRAMEKALRQAVETNALSLVFQPYFLCQSRQVRGYEALLRWTHPQQGVIAPSVFLPLAEASGLIANIDAWVVRTACKMAAAWPGNATLAVNMSAHWFSRGGAVQLVREALAASHLDPARLELELTERTLISSRDVACQQMEGLRRNGVRLAMDDFGVGYSSLAYLRQFPFDKVKLDRAFIAALGEDAKADAVAKAIIQLGHALGMLVCGEGVETADQFAFLAREGCDLAQGYYLGRPADEPLSAVSHCAAVAA